MDLPRLLWQPFLRPQNYSSYEKGHQMISTDVSGKWVPIAEVLKLLERIQELETQLYGSR